MIITSRLPVEKWYELISEKTVADAIMNRLIHKAHRIELKGESLRRKRVINLIMFNLQRSINSTKNILNWDGSLSLDKVGQFQSESMGQFKSDKVGQFVRNLQ